MDWQGELEKEDVIMLTKLIRNKQGDTLYHEIAAGGSVQVSAATILKLQDQCNSSQVIASESSSSWLFINKKKM